MSPKGVKLKAGSLLMLEDESSLSREDIKLVEDIDHNFKEFLRFRQETIASFGKAAVASDQLLQVKRGLGFGGSAVIIVGSCLGIAGGITAIVFTAGVATIPLLVGGLTYTGLGVGASGSVLKLAQHINTSVKEKCSMQEIEKVIREDLEHTFDWGAIHGLNQTTFERRWFVIRSKSMSNEEVLRIRGGEQLAKHLVTTFKSLKDMSNVQEELDVVFKTIVKNVCRSIEMACSESAKLAKTAIRPVVEAVSKSVVKSVTKSVTSSSLKEVASSAAKDVAGSAVKDVAIDVAKQGLKEGGDDVVLLASKGAAQGTAAAALRIAGSSLGIVLGTAAIAWEIYSITQQVKEKSFGNVLRKIQQWLEESQFYSKAAEQSGSEDIPWFPANHECRQCDNESLAKGPHIKINNTNMSPMRIVLIGKTGSGKSATGNTILGIRDAFESRASFSSVTASCSVQIDGDKNLQILDTPGIFDTNSNHAIITDQLKKSLTLLAPGPHAFVLVTSIGRFTQEDKKTVEYFAKLFGEAFYQHLIVVFSHKDELEDDEKKMREYFSRVPRYLKGILEKVQNRYIAFNNKDPKPEQANFLSILRKMICDNGGRCYTDHRWRT